MVAAAMAVVAVAAAAKSPAITAAAAAVLVVTIVVVAEVALVAVSISMIGLSGARHLQYQLKPSKVLRTHRIYDINQTQFNKPKCAFHPNLYKHSKHTPVSHSNKRTNA